VNELGIVVSKLAKTKIAVLTKKENQRSLLSKNYHITSSTL